MAKKKEYPKQEDGLQEVIEYAKRIVNATTNYGNVNVTYEGLFHNQYLIAKMLVAIARWIFDKDQ